MCLSLGVDIFLTFIQLVTQFHYHSAHGLALQIYRIDYVWLWEETGDKCHLGFVSIGWNHYTVFLLLWMSKDVESKGIIGCGYIVIVVYVCGGGWGVFMDISSNGVIVCRPGWEWGWGTILGFVNISANVLFCYTRHLSIVPDIESKSIYSFCMILHSLLWWIYNFGYLWMCCW